MSAVDDIRRKLTEALSPAELDVVDDSHLHKGHLADGSEETHFRVRIVAEAFRGRSRVETHRMINAALGEEFARGMHALIIDAKAPD
jgi:BolA protein